MMRLMKLVLLIPLLSTPTLGASEETCLEALQKVSPHSGSVALKTAAKWLEDNYGAATAEDLKGVSNFAVDAMSLVTADGTLSAGAKAVLRRLFLNEVETKTQEQVGQKKVESSLDALQKMFPDSHTDVLHSAAKWLEDNFGATTSEDLDGVSDWASNGMSLAAGDGRLSAEVKRVLQLFFQGQAAQRQRRLGSSSTTTSSSPTATSTTTTTTTTGTASTTTTTTGPATTTTTTTTGPTTTTTTGPTTTTTTTTSSVNTTTSPTNATTSMKVTTTQGTDLSGAVTMQQLATSIAAMMLFKQVVGF